MAKNILNRGCWLAPPGLRLSEEGFARLKALASSKNMTVRLLVGSHMLELVANVRIGKRRSKRCPR